MHLRRLQLTEFRSYQALDLNVPESGLILAGRNATGKSSLLEAVRMLSTLRSPRSQLDRDVIRWSSGTEFGVAPFSRIVGTATGESGDVQIELGLQRAEDLTGPLRKQIKVNQQSRRLTESIGIVQTVLFTPEDLDIVSGSPSGRRRFIDFFIGQIDRGYVIELARYLRVLEQRNSLLRSSVKGAVSRANTIEQLGFWDEQLSQHGAYISASRRIVLGQLCEAFAKRAPLFTASAQLDARYAPSLGIDFLAAARPDDDRKQVLAVARREFETLIRIRRDEELRRGVTLIGPHRDDLELLIDERFLATFGSRGQQRLAVVALKLAESDVISANGEKPILLLDDVLSELDFEHRATLLNTVRTCGAQVVLTTADPTQIRDTAIVDLQHAEVIDGGVHFLAN